MPSNAIWNDVLKVGTSEKKLKPMWVNSAFWRYLKRCSRSWHCWDFFFLIKVAKWCFLTLFQTMTWKLELLIKLWKQGRLKVHFNCIWNNRLWVWKCWQNVETKTLNGAFWRKLKRFFRNWNCWENDGNSWDNCKTKVAKWCCMTLFETMFWKLEMLLKLWEQGR